MMNVKRWKLVKPTREEIMELRQPPYLRSIVTAIEARQKYKGYKGVALCLFKDGTTRALPSSIAHHSLDVKGRVKEIIREAPTVEALFQRRL